MLNTAKEKIIKNGFNLVAIAKIASLSNLPKGSFYYYFSSKEQLGIEIINNYMCGYEKEIKNLLNNNLNAYDKIVQLHKYYYLRHKKNNWETPCLYMKLSAEINNLASSMQNILRNKTARIINLYIQVVKEGISDGSILLPPSMDVQIAAKSIFIQWKGAAFMSDVYLSSWPLDNFFIYLKSFQKL